MEIIKTSTDSKTAIYKMTQDAGIGKMSEKENEIIEVAEYTLYKDTDKDGVERTVLSIMDADGNCFATNSATFQKDFDAMVAIFGEDLISIKVVGGTSKANRHFITCSLNEAKDEKKSKAKK